MHLNGMKYDNLSIRMKENYEHRAQYFLPRRTYTIMRLDGCHWHTYTRGFKKPFDQGLMEDLDSAIVSLLSEIQGPVFAYTQSDEISILFTDFASIGTNAWYDGNIQKMASVSASIMTAFFNKATMLRSFRNNGMNYQKYFEPIYPNHAFFDSRVFTIPERIEVFNYFVWRQKDCTRNSISSVSQHHFSEKQLHGKSSISKIEMLKEIGVDWNCDYNDSIRYGRIISKQSYEVNSVTRSKWVVSSAWNFVDNREKILNLIPKYESDLPQV